MQLLNRYFTPFALLLVLSAAYFHEPEVPGTIPDEVRAALGLLAASTLVNWWLAANTYRFVGWAGRMRTVQVWMNYVWAVPLFYLLFPYWAPMWLLFLMAPVTAALYMSWWPTLGTALVSAGTMLGIYVLRGLTPEGAAFGMALVHAAVIVLLSLFIHSLAQAALRLISTPRPPG